MKRKLTEAEVNHLIEMDRLRKREQEAEERRILAIYGEDGLEQFVAMLDARIEMVVERVVSKHLNKQKELTKEALSEVLSETLTTFKTDVQPQQPAQIAPQQPVQHEERQEERQEPVKHVKPKHEYELIEDLLIEKGIPMSFKDISKILGIKTSNSTIYMNRVVAKSSIIKKVSRGYYQVTLR